MTEQPQQKKTRRKLPRRNIIDAEFVSSPPTTSRLMDDFLLPSEHDQRILSDLWSNHDSTTTNNNTRPASNLPNIIIGSTQKKKLTQPTSTHKTYSQRIQQNEKDTTDLTTQSIIPISLLNNMNTPHSKQVFLSSNQNSLHLTNSSQPSTNQSLDMSNHNTQHISNDTQAHVQQSSLKLIPASSHLDITDKKESKQGSKDENETESSNAYRIQEIEIVIEPYESSSDGSDEEEEEKEEEKEVLAEVKKDLPVEVVGEVMEESEGEVNEKVTEEVEAEAMKKAKVEEVEEEVVKEVVGEVVEDLEDVVSKEIKEDVMGEVVEGAAEEVDEDEEEEEFMDVKDTLHGDDSQACLPEADDVFVDAVDLTVDDYIMQDGNEMMETDFNATNDGLMEDESVTELLAVAQDTHGLQSAGNIQVIQEDHVEKNGTHQDPIGETEDVTESENASEVEGVYEREESTNDDSIHPEERQEEEGTSDNIIHPEEGTSDDIVPPEESTSDGDPHLERQGPENTNVNDQVSAASRLNDYVNSFRRLRAVLDRQAGFVNAFFKREPTSSNNENETEDLSIGIEPCSSQSSDETLVGSIHEAVEAPPPDEDEGFIVVDPVEVTTDAIPSPCVPQYEDIEIKIEPMDEYYEGFFNTSQSTHDEPVVDEAVVDEAVVDEAVVDEPVVDEPVVDEPVVDEPVVDEPVVDEPVVDEPVVDEPVVDEAVIDEAVVDEAVIDEPGIDEAVIDEPMIDESMIDEPMIDEPMIDEPMVDEPVVDETMVNEESWICRDKVTSLADSSYNSTETQTKKRRIDWSEDTEPELSNKEMRRMFKRRKIIRRRLEKARIVRKKIKTVWIVEDRR